MYEKLVGKVEHYYPKAHAAAVALTGRLKIGDQIHIVGHGDDLREEVTSLQLDHKPIQEGRPGQHVGLYVAERVHEGDDVLLLAEDDVREGSRLAFVEPWKSQENWSGTSAREGRRGSAASPAKKANSKVPTPRAKPTATKHPAAKKRSAASTKRRTAKPSRGNASGRAKSKR
jgi:hypothetical protein